MNDSIEVKVEPMVDGGIDYGFYVVLSIPEHPCFEEEDLVLDEITEYFDTIGITLDFRELAMENGAYIDMKDIFFQHKDDAERVAKVIENKLP